jgi:ABC-type antimicrobial peptide transport system permease subunit
MGEVNPVGIAVALGADDPVSFTPRLRQLAMEVDPALIVEDPMPLDEVTSGAELGRRLTVATGLLLVAILVSLAASGTYALMSFTVTQRTREIGIRTALGAHQSRIVLGVGGRALAQLGLGAALGMALGAWLLGEGAVTISSAGLALLLSAGLFVLVGLLACTGPTLRALRITPTEALKAEG